MRPGEEQILAYAVDLATRVEARIEEERRPAFLVRVKEGAFESHFHRARTTTYALANPSDEPRVLYLEQARQPRWDLDAASPTPVHESREALRFRVEPRRARASSGRSPSGWPSWRPGCCRA